MTIRTATGRVITTVVGRDLVLERYFDAEREHVWRSITDPERTARWFGQWTGESGIGHQVQVTMGFEDGSPTMPMTITACDPPQHLAINAKDEHGEWNLEATIDRVSDRTRLRFVQHLSTNDNAGEIGPGWEYYLDMLVAAETGAPAPDFDATYFPGMSAHYSR